MSIAVGEGLTLELDQFFLRPTSGGGVTRDALGRVVRRFRVETRGRLDGAYDAAGFDETWAFDNGEVEAAQWAVSSGGDGRYVLAEASCGSGIIASRQGGEVTFTHRRAGGLAGARSAVRLSLLTPQVLLRQVRFSLLGAPTGTLTAIHQRAR